MLGDARKNPDEELLNNFLRSPDPKEWRIWRKKNTKELPLEASTYSPLIQRFPRIPEIEVSMLDFFERNDTSLTTRSRMSLSMVSLPALELRFQDPDHPDTTYIGFIEGRENLNNFLREFIKKYNKRYPLEGVVGRAIESIRGSRCPKNEGKEIGNNKL